VNNDFHQPMALFDLLEGLSVKDMESSPGAADAKTNGDALNGSHQKP
jgi:hypothetical protein